jgi:hypothetical protein
MSTVSRASSTEPGHGRSEGETALVVKTKFDAMPTKDGTSHAKCRRGRAQRLVRRADSRRAIRPIAHPTLHDCGPAPSSTRDLLHSGRSGTRSRIHRPAGSIPLSPERNDLPDRPLYGSDVLGAYWYGNRDGHITSAFARSRSAAARASAQKRAA